MSAKSNRAMLEQAEAKIAEAQAAFNKYDADNSGTIDDIEVLQLMADMGLLEKLKTDKVTFLANYFATADTNGDGVLDFEEFKGFYNAAVDDAAGRGAEPAALTPRRSASRREHTQPPGRAGPCLRGTKLLALQPGTRLGDGGGRTEDRLPYDLPEHRGSPARLTIAFSA